MSAVVLVALLFSPLAGEMAFVITYPAYSRHFVDKRKVLKRA